MNTGQLIYRIFATLLEHYGPQGWWPLLDRKTGSTVYGHRPDLNDNQRFEMMVGAVLTQNVAWANAEKALSRLNDENLLDPWAMAARPPHEIARCIKPAGFFNQKTAALGNLLAWFGRYGYSSAPFAVCPTGDLRRELLEIKGVGPETADSILLYALGRDIFVVDAYTRRIFSRKGLCADTASYGEIQDMVHGTWARGFSPASDYNQFHALIVALAKDFCRKKPRCDGCPLSYGIFGSECCFGV